MKQVNDLIVGHTYQARKPASNMRSGLKPLRCVVDLSGEQVTYLANIGPFEFGRTNKNRFCRWAGRDVTGKL